MSTPRRLLIVYHSQSGAGLRLARATLAGALAEPDVDVQCLRCVDAGTAELRQADGLVLIGAENFGALSGGLKNFLDRVFYPVLESEKALSYALIIAAGNDGSGALTQIQRTLTALPWRCVADPMIVRGMPSEHHRMAAQELGATLAAGIAMGIF